MMTASAFRSRLAALALVLGVAVPASGQTAVDVTFRFIPDLEPPGYSSVVRAFVPGSFNDWGPNSSGRIAAGAPSEMTYDADLGEYRYTRALTAGARGVPSDPAGAYTYKLHFHRNASGSEFTWLTDPLGTETFGPNDDSVIRVADPMAFQLAREEDASGAIEAVSVGLFGTRPFTAVSFTVNEDTYTTGIEDTGDGVYRLVLPETVPGGSYVMVEATDDLGRTVTAEVGTLPVDPVDAPVPQGLEDGITVDPADPTRAWLVLRAPDKQSVYAIGSFNGWTADAASLMYRDATAPLGTRWWIELTGLTPGAEYTFQYFVDGETRVADPYTTKVYYPGEAGYPTGQTEYPVGVLHPGAPAFAWTDGDFVAPDQEDLVVYELLVRDFVSDRSFTALIDSLDYLQRLGVNAIELMPVSEFDGNDSWGYNPAFHLALDKAYGTPDEFRALVDAAHARGMAVLLDVVYNHATNQSPLVRLYNSGGYSDPLPGNPYFNSPIPDLFVFFPADFDHTNPLTQLWLDKANRFWVDEYHVDGYRFDYSGGFMPSGDFFSYNQGRIDVLERMMGALWATHPETIVILEHLVENGPEYRRLASYRGPEGARPGPVLWNNQHGAFTQAIEGRPTSLTAAYPGGWAGGVPVANTMTYTVSHDEQWLMYKARSYGVVDGDYNVRDLATALDREKLNGAFFLTVPGPRMLWQFSEVGYGGGPGECLVNGDYPGECAPGVPGRVDSKPIRWDYWAAGVAPDPNGSGVSGLTTTSATERDLRRGLYATWSRLLDLRNRYPIFRSPDTEYRGFVGNAVRAKWMTLKGAAEAEGDPTAVVVVGNFGTAPEAAAPEWPSTGTWYDYFGAASVDVTDARQAVELQPGEFRVFTNVALPGAGPVAEEGGPDDPIADGLVGVFPNPTAGRATVRFELAEAGAVRVDLVDALGRVVATLADGPYAAGPHEVAVDTSGLPAGVYAVRLGGASRRLTVVR